MGILAIIQGIAVIALIIAAIIFIKKYDPFNFNAYAMAGHWFFIILGITIVLALIKFVIDLVN